MNILAIDPGYARYKTGWAVLHNNRLVACGEVSGTGPDGTLLSMIDQVKRWNSRAGDSDWIPGGTQVHKLIIESQFHRSKEISGLVEYAGMLRGAMLCIVPRLRIVERADPRMWHSRYRGKTDERRYLERQTLEMCNIRNCIHDLPKWRQRLVGGAWGDAQAAVLIAGSGAR